MNTLHGVKVYFANPIGVSHSTYDDSVEDCSAVLRIWIYYAVT